MSEQPITVKGKQYAASDPAVRDYGNGPITIVAYWSMRNGEPFGRARMAWSTDKPGTVGRAIVDAAVARLAK